MSLAISSAQPRVLYRYASVGSYINQELSTEANRLGAILQHFEATCRESGYALHVGYLADELRGYTLRAIPIDDWVREVGNGFELADHRSWLDRLTDFIQHWQRSNKLWEDVWQPLFSGALISSSIRVGTAYSGEIIINLPEFLKVFGFNLREVRKWAGLSPYLNHIKYTNIPSHFAKFGLITAVPIIAYKWIRDIGEWTGGEYSGTHLPSAMTVDAGLTLGTNVAAVWAGAKLGAIGGAKIGALVGTGVEPGGGTAIGGAVGAVIGGVVGGVVAAWAIAHYDVREKSITWLDEHVFSPIAKTIAEGVDAVHNWVDEAAARLREQFWKTQDAAGRVRHDGTNKAPNVQPVPTPTPSPKGAAPIAPKGNPPASGVSPHPTNASPKLSEIKWTETDAQNYVKEHAGRLPSKTDSCVDWAKMRAKQIASLDVPPISPYNSKNYGAYNLIDIYGNDVISMPSKESVEKIITTLPPGTLVIWEKGQKGANATYGHVAVIEKVEADGIWVSDSGWHGKGGSPRFIPIDKLQGLHMVPPGSKPISPQEFAERVGKRKV